MGITRSAAAVAAFATSCTALFADSSAFLTACAAAPAVFSAFSATGSKVNPVGFAVSAFFTSSAFGASVLFSGRLSGGTKV